MVKLSTQVVWVKTRSTVEQARKLNLWGCEIDDLSLCEQMPLLEILSVSFNQVHDLRPLANCLKLRELFLRNNKIASLDQLDHLKDLPDLRILWIDGNPATNTGTHRLAVLAKLPRLHKLDDQPVTTEELARAQCIAEQSSDPQALENADFPSGTSPATVQQPLLLPPPPPSDPSETVSNSDETPLLQYRFRPSRQSQTLDRMTRSMWVDTRYGSDPSPWVPEDERDPFGPRYRRMAAAPPPHSDPQRSSSQQNLHHHHHYPPQHHHHPDWADFDVVDHPPDEPETSSRHLQQQQQHKNRDNRAYRRNKHEPNTRAMSSSPAKEQRRYRLLQAVRVLLDELDADGLKLVIEEAQRTLKKKP